MTPLSNAIPALPEDMAQEELDELEDDPEAAAEANGNVNTPHLATPDFPAPLLSSTYVFSPRPLNRKHGQAVKRQRSPPAPANTKENSTSSAGSQSPTQLKRRRTSRPSWIRPLEINPDSQSLSTPVHPTSSIPTSRVAHGEMGSQREPCYLLPCMHG